MDRSSNYTATRYEDKDGNIYALDVQELHEILKKLLGPPRHIKKQEDAVKFKGIILFEGVPSIKDQVSTTFDPRSHTTSTDWYIFDSFEEVVWVYSSLNYV